MYIRLKKRLTFSLLLLSMFFFGLFLSPQESEAGFIRGKWKTEYAEIGDDILAIDICAFSLFVKECHASESRDIRIYKRVE